MILVTSKHLHEARKRHGGYCTNGIGLWFKRYGLDLRHFLRHGYPVELIEGTGDLLGLQVAKIAREES